MGFLPREIQGAFPGESQLQQSHTTQPNVHAGCSSVSIIHQTLTRTTGPLSGLSCKCKRLHTGVYGHQKSLHWKLTFGEKSLAAPGNQAYVSSMPAKCLPTNLQLHPSDDFPLKVNSQGYTHLHSHTHTKTTTTEGHWTKSPHLPMTKTAELHAANFKWH